MVHELCHELLSIQSQIFEKLFSTLEIVYDRTVSPGLISLSIVIEGYAWFLDGTLGDIRIGGETGGGVPHSTGGIFDEGMRISYDFFRLVQCILLASYGLLLVIIGGVRAGSHFVKSEDR